MPFSPRGIEQSLGLPPRWLLIQNTWTLYYDGQRKKWRTDDQMILKGVSVVWLYNIHPPSSHCSQDSIAKILKRNRIGNMEERINKLCLFELKALWYLMHVCLFFSVLEGKSRNKKTKKRKSAASSNKSSSTEENGDSSPPKVTFKIQLL